MSVVVVTYDDQPGLDRVLGALELQDLGTDRFEVVVADDGSPHEPVLAARPYPVRLVRQPDDGFRASAARNLGARGTTGDLLCFLDGDMVPEPGYLSALVGAAGEVGARALLTGRRRHADLAGWDAGGVASWLTGAGPAPAELPEPAWLTEAYERTDDLRLADDESYRYVVGAVTALTRELWEAVGGFDESFTGYGGEDWEIAHRCWLAGAGLRHVRTAVAWHDGPDLAGRSERLEEVLTRQALVLAGRLPSPALRPPGPVFARPRCVVEVDDRGWDPATTLLVVSSLLRGGPDAGVWLAEGAGPPGGDPLADDPRVRRGPAPDEVAGRATWRVRVHAPVELEVDLDEALRRAPGRADGITLQRTRDLALGTPSGRVLAGLTSPVATRELGGLLRARHEAAGRLASR